MKHETNRRIRKAAIRLFVKARRYARRDGSVLVAGLSILTLGLGLSLTASAISIPDANMSDNSQTVAAAQVAAPGEFLYRTSPDGVMAAALPARFEAQSLMFAKALETTGGTTLVSKKATTTTTTVSTTATTSAEETQFESKAETEAESEYEYDYEYEYESETAETVAWDEVEEEETDSEFVNGLTGGSVYDYVSEEEIVMLAKTVAQEGGDCSYTQQACVVWTVLNRVDSWEWPNTISENLNMGGQFAYYSWKPYRDDHYQVAYDQVYNWLFGGERYLDSDYQYFYGDGWRNHFYGKNSGEYVPD